MNSEDRSAGFGFLLRWVFGTAVVGWLLGIGIVQSTGGVALAWPLAGALVGFVQWLALKRHLPQLRGWFVVVAIVGVGIVGFFEIEPRNDARLTEIDYSRSSRVTRGGHQRAIYDIEFSPDGTKVLTGSVDGTAILWDASSGEELRVFRDRVDWVATNPVAFSPDGTRILTGGGSTIDGRKRGVATLRDAQTGDELGLFQSDGYHVDSLAFSPDGTRIVTGGGGDRGLMEGTAKIWDAETGALLTRIEAARIGSVSAVAYSPDGTKLATGSGAGHLRTYFRGDGYAKIWNADSGEELATFETHQSESKAVNGVAFSPDGSMLATTGDDRTARIWDVESGELVRTIEFTNRREHVVPVAFSPDNTRLVTPNGQRGARMWDIDTGDVVRSFGPHDASVTSIAFSPDGSTIAIGDYQGTAKIWDVATGQEVLSLAPRAIPPDEYRLREESRGVRRLDTLPPWDGPWSVSSLAFTPDGSSLLTGSSGSERLGGNGSSLATLWNLDTGKDLQRLEGRGGVRAVAVSHDGTLLLTGGRSDAAKIWDRETGALLQTLSPHDGVVTAVAFSDDDEFVVTSGGSVAVLWNIESGLVERRFPGHQDHVHSVAITGSSDGGFRIATASADNTVRMWDAESGEVLATMEGHGADVYAVQFSPDGSQVLTGSGDTSARLWAKHSGQFKEIQRFGHRDVVKSVAFSPDGLRIVTAGFGELRIWDAGSGALVRSLDAIARGTTGNVYTSVAFSPDGHTLASATTTGFVTVWDVSTGLRQLVRKVGWSWIAVGALIGLILGIGQWWFLQWQVSKAWLWVIGSTLSWTVGCLVVGFLLSPEMQLRNSAPHLTAWASGGLAASLLSGLAMLALLRTSSIEIRSIEIVAPERVPDIQLGPESVPEDDQTEASECIACRKAIPAGTDVCPSCGWSYSAAEPRE